MPAAVPNRQEDKEDTNDEAKMSLDTNHQPAMIMLIVHQPWFS